MRRKKRNNLFLAAILMAVSTVHCLIISYVLSLWKGTGQVTLAYLDPSTGAMIISAIVGVFATILLGVKTFWYKIASLFRGKNNAAKGNKKTK
jgi:hypothetical protein